MDRFGDEEIRAVTEVIRSGRLSSFYKNFLGGHKVTEFEDTFAKYTGARYAISCSNGTSALHMALLAVGCKSGQEIITTPYSFIATTTSILMTGATPVFADVDEWGNLDPDSAEDLITEKTAGILVVHLVGRPAQMRNFQAIADRHGLFLLEDSAQALGAKYDGKHVGTLSLAGTFSLQETKTITSGGEGGMVITNHADIAIKCREIRNHGLKYAVNPMFDGNCYNYRMTEMQAAFGLVQLSKLDHFNRLQVENAKAILDNLPLGIYPKPPMPNAEEVYFIIDCLSDNRDEMLRRINEAGINKGVPGHTIGKGYDKPLYMLPYLEKHCRVPNPTPNVHNLIQNSIWFDIHRWKSRDEALQILKQISKVIESRSLVSSA